MSATVRDSRDGAIGAWSDLVLSEDRRELVATALDHFAARFPRDMVRRAFDSGQQPADVWDELTRSEYHLVGVPEEFGGLGSMVDLAALLEAAGHELVPAPLLATALSDQTRLTAGLAIESGQTPGALAVGTGTVLDGVVRAGRVLVLDGVRAVRLTVVLTSGDGPVTATVDASAVRPVAVRSHVDPCRPMAEFDLDGVPALGVAAPGMDEDSLLARARIAIAADLTGIAAGALEQAVEHAQAREQFGKKIGAFQGVKHRLADLLVAVERARSLTRAAAVAAGRGSAEPATLRELSLLAKAASTEAAVDSSRAYVQVLGAMGMTFEADAHLYFRRAQQTAPFLGSASECYRRAARCRQEGAQ